MPVTSGHVLTKEDSRKGGLKTKEKFGVRCPTCGHIHIGKHFSVIGAKGGDAVVEKYGREHMQKIGRRGGRPRTKPLEEGNG